MSEGDLHEQLTIGGLSGESTQEFPVKSWDRYKFVAFIGEGGMGRVYKAFVPTLKRSAEKNLQRATELNPLDAWPFVVLAECKLFNSNLDEGLNMIDKALALNPNLAEA